MAVRASYLSYHLCTSELWLREFLERHSACLCLMKYNKQLYSTWNEYILIMPPNPRPVMVFPVPASRWGGGGHFDPRCYLPNYRTDLRSESYLIARAWTLWMHFKLYLEVTNDFIGCSKSRFWVFVITGFARQSSLTMLNQSQRNGMNRVWSKYVSVPSKDVGDLLSNLDRTRSRGKNFKCKF